MADLNEFNTLFSIILDKNATITVERYENEFLAQEGHNKWVEKIKNGLEEIEELEYGFLEGRKIKLIPRENNNE